MPLGQRRLSIVKEATMAEIRPEEISPKISPEIDSSVKGMKTIKNESSKTPKKTNKDKNAMNPGDNSSSTISTATTSSSPTVKAKLEEKRNGKMTPLFSKRKKKDGEKEEQKKSTPSINEAKETPEKNVIKFR
jgi:hypothetical protein